jgi:hypothetical protein
LQLVAIKRLQTHGLSLAEIQSRLVGRTNAALRQLARLPADMESVATAKPQAAERDRFWNAPPAQHTSCTDEIEPEPAAYQEMRPLTGIPLGEGTTLLLNSPRSLDEHDFAALHVAAAPLLKLLKARRLLAADEGTPHTKGEST